MQYRDYGNTGIKVSALGFGCMRLPMVGDNVDIDKSVEMIRYAIDHGVNYLDTAYGYCNSQSETALGLALKDGYREKVYLSTKNPSGDPDGGKWRRILEHQLEKLQVDYIDFYHFHGIGWDGWNGGYIAPGGPRDMSIKAQEEGLIRYRTFSFHDKPEALTKLVDTGEFAGVTAQYNLLDRSNEEALAYAASKGLGVVVMGPVGGGRLGAPSPEIQRMVPGGVKSTAEVALRFVLAQPWVSVALSGMSTLQQVVENVATASRTEPLTEAERAHVLASLEENRRLAELYCTGCNYCMPCPNGVDIPANFRAMNYYRVYGLKDHAAWEYRHLGQRKVDGQPRPAWAEACLECGECEPKCPQKIEIIRQLKETREALSAP